VSPKTIIFQFTAQNMAKIHSKMDDLSQIAQIYEVR